MGNSCPLTLYLNARARDLIVRFNTQTLRYMYIHSGCIGVMESASIVPAVLLVMSSNSSDQTERSVKLVLPPLLHHPLRNASAPWASSKGRATDALPPQAHRRRPVPDVPCEGSVVPRNVQEDLSLCIRHGSTRHTTLNFMNTTLADYLHMVEEIVTGLGCGRPSRKAEKTRCHFGSRHSFS